MAVNANNGIILTVSAPISVVSSAIIIFMILRSRLKLSNIYHRIMFGMSVTDMILSFALAFSSLPAPVDTPNTWKAIGNRSTCSAQGYFIMFGTIAAPFYFGSLQIYYFCMIKYQTNRAHVKRLEPYLHGAPILFGLIIAIVGLATDSMNPGTRGYCWTQDFPLHCIQDDMQCIRGMTLEIQRIVMIALYLLNGLLVFILMWKIFATVREQDCRNASHDFRSSARLAACNNNVLNGCETSVTPRRLSLKSPEETKRAQYQKSRKTRQRVLHYFTAYLLTHSFPFIDWILHSVERVDNLLEISYLIFYPLGGFFNLVVFVLPTVRKAQERNPDFCLCKAIVTAVLSYAGPGPRTRNRASFANMPTPTLGNISDIELDHRLGCSEGIDN